MTVRSDRWAPGLEPGRPPAPRRWRRAPGLCPMGEVRGSGLTDRRFLVRRSDGQVVQLSHLLELVLREVSQTREPATVADRVSTAYGRRLTVEGLEHLLDTRLSPLGLVVDAADPPAPDADAPRADPLLSLRLRGTLLPPRASNAVARVLAPLFHPVVVVAALAALVWTDVLLLQRADAMAALEQVLAVPVLLLALMAVLTASAVGHEMGHAAATAYGGGRPGRIGVGIYLVFPAFFTDVTDSYRLSRSARIRTDLGGLYFNVLLLVAGSSAYLATGHGLLLLAVLIMHLQMLQQLVPVVRLDGYWVLSDLAGVPDLFARMGPVVSSLLPGRPTDPRVAELRPTARRIVVAWVVTVVPLLVLAVGWLLVSTPVLLARTWEAATLQVAALRSAVPDDVVGALVAAVSLVLLVLPVLGLGLLVHRLVLLLVRMARRRPRLPGRPRLVRSPSPRHAREVPVSTWPNDRAVSSPWEKVSTSGESDDSPWPADEPRPEDTRVSTQPPAVPPHTPPDREQPPPAGHLSAAAFTDETVLGQRRPPPTRGWRRGLFTATGGRLNTGPSEAERAEQALHERINATIVGSRRVVVMSRKGGVGKTTVTLALGSTFAMTRGDRVVAVDANPDAGNLAYRVARRSGRTLTDLLADAGKVDRYATLRGYLSQASDSGLEVLASDDDPRITLALDRHAYEQVIDVLDHFYNLILLDTGTGILDSANQGLLHEADQLVLVLRPALDGARAAAATLDWLEEHGYGELVTRAVVAVNGTRRGSEALTARLEEHFRGRCAAVVAVPWDRNLEVGARNSLTELERPTRRAFAELAAAVADSFAATGAVR